MSDSNPNARIKISQDDLATPQVEARLQAMEEAKRVALVRDVGMPTKSGGGAWRSILTLAAGGAVGGFVAFLLLRLLLNVLGLFDDNAFLNNVTFSFVLAFAIGLSVSLASVVTERSWARVGYAAAIAVPASIVSGLVFGLIAHLVYSSGIEWLVNSAYDQVLTGEKSEDQAVSYIELWIHPLRGLAWLVVGTSAGIAAGASSRSWKKVGLAAAGGAIGGFLGGFIFDFIPAGDSEASASAAEAIAQVVGIVLLGTLIGLSMGLLEQAGKSRWIEIVAGGLAGKQFILYKNEIQLGSSPRADITLIKDPSVSEVAAVLQVKGSRSTITSVDQGAPVLVNGSPVWTADVHDNDLIAIGNTQLRFREKASSQKMPGALA